MECKYCNYKTDKCKSLKTHLTRIHKDVPKKDIELFYFNECYPNIDIDIILKKYRNGYSLQVISKEYNIHRSIINNVFLSINEPIRGIKDANNQIVVKEKVEKYFQQIYGVNNPSKLKEVKEKKKETSLKNNGYINNFCNKEIRDVALLKIDHIKSRETYKKTLLERYGVEYIHQIPEINKKISKSQIERYSKISYEDKLKMTEYARSCVKNVSKLEIRIQNILNTFNIKYTKNAFLYRYNFDFIFKNKKILEVQGDLWHANPNKYKETDLIANCFFAGDVWKKDFRKKKIVEENGYKVYYLWENEINKMSDEDIRSWLITNIIL